MQEKKDLLQILIIVILLMVIGILLFGEGEKILELRSEQLDYHRDQEERMDYLQELIEDLTIERGR